MTFQHLNRRTHLYLSLFLLPWFLMYGLSSIPFSHSSYFQELDKAKKLPDWYKRFERTYETPPPEGDNLRQWGRQVMNDVGIEGAYGVYRQSPNQVNIYVYSSVHSVQLKYFVAEKRLVAEDKRFRFDHFLTGLHARGGFEQETFLNDLWGVIVDLACAGFLLWVVSGLIMWWNLPAQRGWGWVALIGGVASFTFFLLRL